MIASLYTKAAVLAVVVTLLQGQQARSDCTTIKKQDIPAAKLPGIVMKGHCKKYPNKQQPDGSYNQCDFHSNLGNATTFYYYNEDKPRQLATTLVAKQHYTTFFQVNQIGGKTSEVYQVYQDCSVDGWNADVESIHAW